MNKFPSAHTNSSQLIFSFIRILFGIVFITSGLLKLIDIDSFAKALRDFKLIDGIVLKLVVITLPILEISLGILICLKIKPVIFSQATGIMVVFFTAIVTTKIIEGENINCNCFGNITDGKIDYSTIVRNICLISVSIILAVYYSYIKNKFTDDSSLSRLSDKKVYRNFFIQNFKTYLLYFTFFFLSVQSVVLSYQNRVLKERLTILMQKNDLLQQGDTILPFFVKDINGNEKLILSNGNQKTVIFLFSTRCSACTSNYPIWNKLFDTLSHAGINTFALSIDTVSESTVKGIKAGYNIYSISNKNDIKKNFKQLITPQTIMVDENNVVIGCWIGLFNQYDANGILKRK